LAIGDEGDFGHFGVLEYWNTRILAMAGHGIRECRGWGGQSALVIQYSSILVFPSTYDFHPPPTDPKPSPVRC
jgi:hypothetical protein